MAERLGDAERGFARLGDLQRDRVAARHGREAKDALAMLVLGGVPEDVPAVGPAREDDREFRDEVDAGFGDRGLLADRGPRGLLRRARADPRLALAVIAIAAGLQHQRQAELGDGCA